MQPRAIPGITLFITAVLLVSLMASAHAVVYVKYNPSTPTEDGNSWATAYKTVQQGINDAKLTGEEVWVARGTYVERLSISGNVALYGGFYGTETARDQRNFKTRVTILDGAQLGTVVTASGGSTGITIDGFTIRNGTHATKSAGIYSSSSNMTIANNIITGCTTTNGGSAVYCGGGNSSAIGNTIVRNSGGVTWYAAVSVTMSNNTIAGNTGYGVFFTSGTPVAAIHDNIIAENSGAGIYALGSGSGSIISNTIYGNIGDGIRYGWSTATIANNLVARNRNVGIYGPTTGTSVLRNNCVFESGDSDYQGVTPGADDISADPMLTAPQYGRYHIEPGSPCIDAGSDGDVQAEWLDIDGQPRVQGAHVDIGADESDGTSWDDAPVIIRVRPDGSDFSDGLSWPFAKKTVQAGIDAAARLGGEVWVKAGKYTESFTLCPFVYVYGGFTGSEETRAARSAAANTTILDGGGAGGVVTARGGWWVSALDGFLITNGVREQGGAIYCHYSSPVITNNTIAGNSSGVLCYYSSAVLTNNTITGNGGTGLMLTSSVPSVANNIIAFNANGIHGGSSPTVLRNNCVYGNSGYNYNYIAPGPGDISADPLLTDVSYLSTHIRPGSPCINAGWNDAPGLPSVDFDRQPRIHDGNVDIGADEFDGTVWPVGPTRIVRVSPTGSDYNDGSTWATAKLTLQAAIDSAFGGDVWVKAGTYNTRITLRPYAHLFGGFAGSEVLRDNRNPSANLTIIDGMAGGSVVTANTGYGASTIDGFTIRNGAGTPSYLGGGIYCDRAAPRIANNTIIDNAGHGVYLYSSSATLTGNNITSNDWAGVYLDSSAPRITGNAVTGNGGGGVECKNNSAALVSGNVISGNLSSGGGGGGAVTCRSSSATITGNTITGNTGRNGGGGIMCIDSIGAVFSNNVITNNTATWGGGGGISFSGASINCALTNNTIVGNTAEWGGGVFFTQRARPAVSNNIVASNSSGVCNVVYLGEPLPVLRNNCVYGNTAYNYQDISAGTGDIAVDPLLGPEYHLPGTSPCVNAGWNDAPGMPIFDIDGHGRIFGRKVDIGAYEHWSGTMSITDARFAADGAAISGANPVVSAAFDGFFYIEAEDRSCGIRVDKVGHGVAAGDRVSIAGALRTNSDGERYIEATSVEKMGVGSIAPVHIFRRALGGSGWYYNPATGAGQCGVVGGLGLNNIGLLVTTWGKLVQIDGLYFLDQGPNQRVRVISDATGIADNTHVRITGISSCLREPDGLHPALRPTSIVSVE